MVQINFSLKEVNCKVVYYGPGLSGKTTNLEVVHSKAPDTSVGELTSIATEGDRTLFFDFLPLNLGQVAGMKTKFQIYTVPGQVYYNSTRKLVLQGADGIVFVADSKRGKMEENIESLENLKENLIEFGLDINTTPIVLQYNKRDLPEVYTIEEMQQALNHWNAPYFEAVARDGTGVFPTLKKLAGVVLESLNQQHGSPTSAPAGAPAPSAPAAGGAPAGGGMAPAAAPQYGGSATAVAEPPPQQIAAQAAPMAPPAMSPASTNGVPMAGQMPAATPPMSPEMATTTTSGGARKSRRPLIIGIALAVAAAAAGAYALTSGIW